MFVLGGKKRKGDSLMIPFQNLLGSGLRKFLNWQGQQRAAQIEGTLDIPGLQKSVEVQRDQWGVPHIFAQNNHDLFMAQGFVHAQDRLWQMELNRRLASGRLSEIFGETTLETDRAARTFGFSRLGKADLKCSSDSVRQMLVAYAQGVNAVIDSEQARVPVECMLLRFKPEPWTPEDTMSWIRLVFWQMSRAWYGEIIRAQVIEAVGEEHAKELDIRYPDENPVALPDGIEFNRIPLSGVQDVPLQRNWGSNAWAISGERSKTDMPFVCNDMHLPVTVPSTWYQNHLISDEINVTGVSMPGIPMVLGGHNEHIAWGITLAYTDCEDLYIEQFDVDIPDRYLYKGKWMQAETITESILVNGWNEPHHEEVRITRHGPVISDIIGHPEQKLALQSMSLRSTRTGDALLALNQASNWNEFTAAVALVDAPQLNIVYGDVHGNTGYRVTGKVPVRAKGWGILPSPGWTGEYEWIGEIPFEEMPHAFNPSRGYIVSANHRIVSDEYPHYLGSDFMNGYRARRLIEMIESRDRLDAGDFAAMQLDVTTIPGLAFTRCLQGFESTDSDVDLALQRLRNWNGKLTTDTVGGTIYEVAMQKLIRHILEPKLGKALTEHMMGLGWSPVMYPSHEFNGRDTVAVLRMLEEPDSWWLKSAGGRDHLLETALREAVQWLRQELDADVDQWQWGKIHKLEYAHPLGRQTPLNIAFNRGPYPVGGDSDTPNQTGYLSSEPYDNKLASPSMRFIMDLGDFSRSLAILPMGQSGQIGTQHYDDLIEMYLEGEYYPMLWTREQIEKNLEGRLILQSIFDKNDPGDT
jgi:penicillin G amidase